MASSSQPPDLIEKADNGLVFTILRRPSSTGSLQVPASSIGFDGFVATAEKSPSRTIIPGSLAFSLMANIALQTIILEPHK